ncbi:MAG: alanine racemase [Clostridia bacterium]|nr:alanine racemase [Clostridia bacterium]
MDRDNPLGLRTWLDIDLDAVRENYRTACSLTRAKITAVLKANAYGHGLIALAQCLEAEGCDSFAVSCAREAMALRRNGIRGEILVLGMAEARDLKALLLAGVRLTIADAQSYAAAGEAARALGCRAYVHLKVDTGFHRLGFACTEESADRIMRLHTAYPEAVTEGLYSHLGLITKEKDEAQYRAFMRMREWLAQRHVPIAEYHLCDSIGLVRYPAWHMSRCRVGAFLWGVRPSRSEDMPFADKETLRFCTTVAQVRDVPAGEAVGYGDEDVSDHPMRVATLCAGYGDGYPRRLSNGRGHVLIRGRRARVVGLVCMDQMMVDVTDIPDCCAGDTAVLLGGGISYAEMADWAGTNRNECLTILSARPVRVYHEAGKEPRVWDSLTGENTVYGS